MPMLGEINKSNSGGNTWNGGATSTKKWSGDVTLEFHCSQQSGHAMMGFTTHNGNTHYNDMECAFYCDSSNQLSAYEGGSHRATFAKRDAYTKPPDPLG